MKELKTDELKKVAGGSGGSSSSNVELPPR
ncbi:hypothetical protein N473_19535 [Pseudoalteromonas luteoviolacea CPMOR-1]|uniref:Uncharacterized protein n=1 Tax=Pseudoalteromonas luteoviolacea CPMOR-1 TaxID=1365248 RepID=A0A167KC63_9GAMM|nr:ComC/BlpC family leader-containing pheromone/bacteriocin [Pseudoalteromonas luteoviolacea]KZN62448.1 hypothetical protein N473_19535 [Pseudoalteromonas luteoviolacea CPMOR-1]